MAERVLTTACLDRLATCEIVLRTRFAYYYGTHVGSVGTFARGVGFTRPPTEKIAHVDERILSDLNHSTDAFIAHYHDDIKEGTMYLPAAYDRMPIRVAVEVLSWVSVAYDHRFRRVGSCRRYGRVTEYL